MTREEIEKEISYWYGEIDKCRGRISDYEDTINILYRQLHEVEVE